MRQIDIIATRDGRHYIEVGFNNNELASFSWMLWVTHYGKRMIDWMQAMGLGFITFLKGDVWVHNSSLVDRCNLYGEKRDCIVGVVSNEQPNRIKLYDSVGIHSNEEWEITEIVIPPSLNYPSGMYSKLPTSRFKKREGVWQAEFMRNMKTTSGTINVIDAIKGEPLRGEEIYMLLKNTSDDQVKLFKVNVNQTLSRV